MAPLAALCLREKHSYQPAFGRTAGPRGQAGEPSAELTRSADDRNSGRFKTENRSHRKSKTRKKRVLYKRGENERRKRLQC